MEKELGEIPYIRFNVKEGHIALPIDKEDIVNKEIEV